MTDLTDAELRAMCEEARGKAAELTRVIEFNRELGNDTFTLVFIEAIGLLTKMSETIARLPTSAEVMAKELIEEGVWRPPPVTGMETTAMERKQWAELLSADNIRLSDREWLTVAIIPLCHDIDRLLAALAGARADAREACAALVEKHWGGIGKDFAAMIRSRIDGDEA